MSAARASGDSAFGLHAAEGLRPGVFDVLDYVVRAAPTVRASFERLAAAPGEVPAPPGPGDGAAGEAPVVEDLEGDARDSRRVISAVFSGGWSKWNAGSGVRHDGP